MRTFTVFTAAAAGNFKCPIKGTLVAAVTRSGRAVISSDPTLTLAATETTDLTVVSVISYMPTSGVWQVGLSFPLVMGQVLYLAGQFATVYGLMIAD